MGGRITLERMTCSSPSSDNSQEKNNDDDDNVFVRINVNDRIVELPRCNSGPGKSCRLDHFVRHVEQRREEVGDFAGVCGLEGDVGYISFLRQD